jgi:hypothetical protein
MAVLGCFTVVAVVLVFTFVMFAGMYVMAVL